MSRIDATSSTAAPATFPAQAARRSPAADPGAADLLRRGRDEVELSINRRTDTPGVRQELVDRIRREIAEGSFETPERLDATVDALVGALNLPAGR